MAGLTTNERYVVVGLAKTGTTIVATTMLRTLKIRRVLHGTRRVR
jgi:hypothetical protein